MKTLERIILLLAAIVTIIVGIATIASWPSIKGWLSKSQTTQTEESAAAKAKEERKRKEDEAKAAEELKRNKEEAERRKKEAKEHQKWISLNPGDIIEFGQYPFYEDGTVKPIEWRVLANNRSKVLLITKMGIDAVRYNEKLEDIVWENSSIRRWLNETFINKAFTAEQHSHIIKSPIENKDNAEFKTRGGGVSNDKLFLLSIDEANDYFKGDDDRKAYPTPYANSKLEMKCSTTCMWWLRSPGKYQTTIATVRKNGNIYYDRGISVESPFSVVRVALWYDLNNL